MRRFGNIDADRVRFTEGRDLELTPRQSGAPLNFFVYPYLERNGRRDRRDVSDSFAFAELRRR